MARSSCDAARQEESRTQDLLKMQRWRKLGRIFEAKGQHDWMQTHAAVPFVEWLDEDRVRIYFSARDSRSRSHTGWIVVSLHDPSRTVELSSEPVVPLGDAGFFDEDGVMGCDLLEVDGRRFLYYIGWNRAVSVPFRNAIGLAVSDGREATFRKYSTGPILDRTIHDPCFVASHCVIREEGRFRMWYLSCERWSFPGGRPRHHYNIKHAESPDGIEWTPTGDSCVDFKYENEYAISVPRVHQTDSGYGMWYSYRGGPKSDLYRIGYAESADGLVWSRQDESVDLGVASEGWDSEMICYPYVFDWRGDRYMLYNGNGYGATGFGLAVLE